MILYGFVFMYYLYLYCWNYVTIFNVLLKSQITGFISSFRSQFFYDPDGFGIQKKARIYINDMWNILDLFSIILFVIGLTFR